MHLEVFRMQSHQLVNDASKWIFKFSLSLNRNVGCSKSFSDLLKVFSIFILLELSHRSLLINGHQYERLNIDQHAYNNQIFFLVLMEPTKIACTSIFSFLVSELFYSLTDFQEFYFWKRFSHCDVHSAFAIYTDELAILQYLPKSYRFESYIFTGISTLIIFTL